MMPTPIGHHRKKTGTLRKRALIAPPMTLFTRLSKDMSGSSTSMPSTDRYHSKNLLFEVFGNNGCIRNALVLTSLQTSSVSINHVTISCTNIVTAASPASVLSLIFHKRTV